MSLLTDCGRVKCSHLLQPVWVLHVLEQRIRYLTDSCRAAEPPHLQIPFSLTVLFCVSRFCVTLCCTDWVFGECPSKHRISCIRLLIFVQKIPNKNTFLGYLVKHSKPSLLWEKLLSYWSPVYSTFQLSLQDMKDGVHFKGNESGTKCMPWDSVK